MAVIKLCMSLQMYVIHGSSSVQRIKSFIFISQYKLSKLTLVVDLMTR